MSDQQLLESAISAYRRYCERSGVTFQQPDLDGSVVGPEYIILKSARGDLSKYDIEKGEIVVFGYSREN